MSVDFDPVRLRPNRRRIDPVDIGIALVVVGIAAAVVKPWDGSRQADAPALSSVAATTAVRTAGPAGPVGPVGPVAKPVQTPGPMPLTWSDLAFGVGHHTVWGVEAVVAGPPTAPDASPPRAFQEIWAPSVKDASGGERAYVARDQQSIVAIGVQAPPRVRAEDARIWRLHDDGRLEWVDTHPVFAPETAGTLLLVQPASSGLPYTSWAGGHYRIDLLTDTGIDRIEIEIPGRFGNVPDPDPWPPALGNLVAARNGDPTVTRQGLFATDDGVSVDLPATVGPTLDEAGEWRAELGQSGDQIPNVAVARLPRATGLGVMFTERAVVSSATIRRLAPDDRIEAAPAFGGISSLHSRTPYLVFTPRDGAAWAPGAYAVSAAWTDPAGAHAGTWYVELRPGSVAPGPGVVFGSHAGG